MVPNGPDGKTLSAVITVLLQMLYERPSAISRCSAIAVAATGLLLPEGFSRCCPQPGYRSGCDQGRAGGDPRPAPLHGPGRPRNAVHDVRGFRGDREHRQPPRVAQAPRHADDHRHDRGNKLAAGGRTAISGGPQVFPSRREPGPVCQACASGPIAAGSSLAPRPRSALPCQGPTPPARSQQRLPTRPGPAAGARRPSARPRRRPG